MSLGVASSVSPTPRNRSFGEMMDQVARYVQLPGDYDKLTVGDFINDGIDELNLEYWYWRLTFQDIWTVADQADYELNKDYDSNFHIELMDADANPKTMLEYMDPQNFLRCFQRAESSGKPVACTAMSPTDTLQLTFNKKPSAEWVNDYPLMRVRYWRRLQHLASESDRLICPSEAELYVKWYAKAEMADVFDPSRARRAVIERERVLGRLRKKDNEHHFRNWS